MKKLLKYISLAVIAATLPILMNLVIPNAPFQSAQAQQVISLTQTGCQFVETESQNYNYQTESAQDCRQINNQTLKQREDGFKPISLKAGKYVFRVKNESVPYELGFYLRGQGASQALLPTVSGGGLTPQGTTLDYAIDLKKGKYYMSCPLNPTPDYEIIVQ